MPRRNNRVPETETRGGDKVDWLNARPGMPLPELPADEYPEPDSGEVPRTACGPVESDNGDKTDD